MTSRVDSRQSRQRSKLDQLSTVTDIRLDAILNLINDELTPPLRLRSNEKYSSSSDVNNECLWIDGIEVLTYDSIPSVAGTGRSRTIPPINNALPSYAGGGYINFATDGTITATGLALASSYSLTGGTTGEYAWVMVMINSSGDFVLSIGAFGATKATAVKPPPVSSTYIVGLVAIQKTGASTYGTVNNENIIQLTSGSVGLGLPATSNDNAVARWDGTTGGAIQNSSVIIDDDGNVDVPAKITSSGQLGAVIENIISAGPSLEVDWNDSNMQKITLTGNCLFSFINPVAGFSYVLILVQGGVGGNLATWPGTVKWKGGSAPVLSSTPDKADLISLIWDGSNYYGTAALSY